MVFIQSAAAASLCPAAFHFLSFLIYPKFLVIIQQGSPGRSGGPVRLLGHVSCCRYRVEILIFSLRG
jgi:hypothetical protein